MQEAEVNVFGQLNEYNHSEPDQRGERHIQCPKCGHGSSPKKPHCSYNKKGWHCFVCGEGGSLTNLAQLIDMQIDKEYHAPPQKKKEKEKKSPDWMKNPEIYVRQYEEHPLAYELWDEYKLLPRDMIARHRLGVGVLPRYSSRCQHQRLIVPVIVGTMIVGLRGRAINCNCGKWLAAEGTVISMMPLYGIDEVLPGSYLWIVENPVDALMITAYSKTQSYGLATYSASYWSDTWTAQLIELKPRIIYIAYDNDLVGNGGAWRRQQMINEWLQDPRHKNIPESNGIRRANELVAAGLHVRLFDWMDASPKSDIGSLLAHSANTGIF
jgi:hypothetical protein